MNSLQRLVEKASWYKTVLDKVPGFVQILTNEGVYLDLKTIDENRLWLPRKEDHFGRHLEEVLPTYLLRPRLYYFHEAVSTGKTQRYNQKFWSDEFSVFRDYNILIQPLENKEVIVVVRDRMDGEEEFPVCSL